MTHDKGFKSQETVATSQNMTNYLLTCPLINKQYESTDGRDNRSGRNCYCNNKF